MSGAPGSGSAGPREHHLEVVRRARYYELGDVADAGSELWIVCHGYRQLAGRFLRRFRPLDDGTRRIVAPEALSRFYLDETGGPHGPESRVGASWMTREDRQVEIADYVEYLDTLDGTLRAGAPARVVALGFSQGAATASRWAVLGNAAPDRLVLWAGAVAHDLDLEQAAPRLRAARPILVVGDRDALVGSGALERETERLRDHGIPVRVVRYDGGHHIDADALRRVGAIIREEARDPASSSPPTFPETTRPS